MLSLLWIFVQGVLVTRGDILTWIKQNHLYKLEPKAYKQEWHLNRIDHFDNNNKATFKQRYWKNDNFINSNEKEPSAFLYICGEGECGPPKIDKNFPLLVGIMHSAVIFALEHRYYGLSQPFSNLSTENLRQLTSRQALADIATFIETQNAILGYEAKWVVVGGSYAGALAAWFKTVYPKHAVGAWASSAVILAKKDFSDFDLDVYLRTRESGNDCSKAIKDVTYYVSDLFTNPKGIERLTSLFKIGTNSAQVATNIDFRDFSFFLADIFATHVQYGKREYMCAELMNHGDEDVLSVVAGLADERGLSYDDYSTKELRDININPSKASRQWMYQYCNEFGWFQTPNHEEPMRSNTMDLEYWYDYCYRVFDLDLRGQSDKINDMYGGLDIKGDNIAFINGSEDPWRSVSYTDVNRLSYGTGCTIDVINMVCSTCGHCVDMSMPVEGQPLAISRGQVLAVRAVSRWLGNSSINSLRGKQILYDEAEYISPSLISHVTNELAKHEKVKRMEVFVIIE